MTAGRPRGTGPDGHPEDAYDAAPFVPERAGLNALREAAAHCRGCPLHVDATQTVFGSGDADARVVFVGEQPGDREDRRGEPFVGPAGRVLRDALDEAGIDPDEAYVTNAVKHFKFTTTPGRGKRRIHKAPGLREMSACAPWLNAELALIDPEVMVALGATAGKALLGSSYRVSGQRGALLDRSTSAPGAHGASGSGTQCPVVGTIHPSAVLRAENRDEVYAGLVADLRVAAEVLR